jgi:hypothetical protein
MPLHQDLNPYLSPKSKKWVIRQNAAPNLLVLKHLSHFGKSLVLLSRRKFSCEMDRRGSGPERETQNSRSEGVSGATGVFEERHYTVAEIAEMWKLSKDAVRRLFCKEPGVLTLGNPTNGRKRRYTTLRIPQSVLERVHRILSFG